MSDLHLTFLVSLTSRRQLQRISLLRIQSSGGNGISTSEVHSCTNRCPSSTAAAMNIDDVC